MNTFKLAGAVALTGALLLGGCGNFGKNADKSNREDADIIHEDEKEGGTLETGGGYGFSSFDLEIDVGGSDAIDAKYESNQVLVAEFENKLKNIKLTNNEAMEELDRLFMTILLNRNTTSQGVIEKILTWYGLDSYSKFDLEVNFDDGTVLNIDDVK